MSTENREQEPNRNVNGNENLNSETKHEERQSSSTRTPFTDLNQVDADLALARTLQEQERAYMMLSMNYDGISSGYGSYLHDDDFDHLHDHDDTEEDDDEDDEGEYDGTDDDDDDDDDENNTSVELDPADFPSDEAYARALQDAEEREMAVRLFALAGINDRETVTLEDHGHSVVSNSQDSWGDVDPDELSYEELIALGEVVGTESRGLSADAIASLPSLIYKAGNSLTGCNDSCVICRVDYEDGDSLTALSCKHSYHPECINNWLNINKVCPVCSAEVST